MSDGSGKPGTTGTTDTSGSRDTTPTRKPIWERHRRPAIAAAVLVIVLVTVLTDLPTSTSRASDIGAERSVMNEVNSDLSPCAFAINQALGIWRLEAAHQLSAADRAPTPGLLSDDQSACSFTNNGIYDLSDIQVPGTPAGKQLGQLVATAMLWTTSDALRAIEDVQTLMNDGGDSAALRSLTSAETSLASDRRLARSEEAAADRDLGTHLQTVDLPALQGTSSGSSGQRAPG
jgi:hypothetical protein